MTRIATYIDAVRAKRAIESAIQDEGRNPARDSALLLAAANVRITYGRLSGREAWLAARELEGAK